MNRSESPGTRRRAVTTEAPNRVKIVDTNVFIRYLTGTPPDQAELARVFFKRLEAGEERATTIESVVSEVVYVLSSKRLYGLEPGEIEARLRPLLRLRGLQLPAQRRYLRALTLYASLPWADFEDALIVAQMEEDGIETIVSFDRGFDKLEGHTRADP